MTDFVIGKTYSELPDCQHEGVECELPCPCTCVACEDGDMYEDEYEDEQEGRR